jgi:hypothetical protein
MAELDIFIQFLIDNPLAFSFAATPVGGGPQD